MKFCLQNSSTIRCKLHQGCSVRNFHCGCRDGIGAWKMAELGWSEGGGAMTTPGGVRPLLEDVGAELLFEKVLTPCDAASRGRIVLPKVHSCLGDVSAKWQHCEY
jgi:hypothetical protein